jgi:hypothetical protein
LRRAISEVKRGNMNLPLHRGFRFGKSRAAVIVCALAAISGFRAVPARGDQAPGVQMLQIVDLGNFLVLNWNFYYGQFPTRFALKEKQNISFEDPATLERNLSELALGAFDLRIDGRPVPPAKIASLTIAPNKFCTAKVIYPGRPGGHLEVRAPVLKYLPPAVVINFSVMGMGRTSRAVTGDLTAEGGPFPDVIRYQEVAEGGDTSMPSETAPANFFKNAVRIPWINLNWLLIVLILFLTQGPAQVLTVTGVMTGAWWLLCVLRLPWQMPELVAGLATALVGAMAAMRPGRSLALAFAACAAGLVNTVCDLQQLRSAEWFGSCLGFTTGMASVLAVLGALLWECKKYPEFDREWAPRLCWFSAALAVLLPIQRGFSG